MIIVKILNLVLYLLVLAPLVWCLIIREKITFRISHSAVTLHQVMFGIAFLFLFVWQYIVGVFTTVKWLAQLLSLA